VTWFPDLYLCLPTLCMQAHEHHLRPQILSGMDEEGGEPICPFRLEASGWDGFPRFSSSTPFLTFLGGVQGTGERKRRAECAVPWVGVGPSVWSECGAWALAETKCQAMRHGVKSLRESWCRAECAPGRTWAAEGNGRRPIVCTRNRTDPISGSAKNGDAPGHFPGNRTYKVELGAYSDVGLCNESESAVTRQPT